MKIIKVKLLKNQTSD